MWMVGLFIETGKAGVRALFSHTEFERSIGIEIEYPLGSWIYEFRTW